LRRRSRTRDRHFLLFSTRTRIDDATKGSNHFIAFLDANRFKDSNAIKWSDPFVAS
jgi:hypothetical protein